jgi:hypothetical protein
MITDLQTDYLIPPCYSRCINPVRSSVLMAEYSSQIVLVRQIGMDNNAATASVLPIHVFWMILVPVVLMTPAT